MEIQERAPHRRFSAGNRPPRFGIKGLNVGVIWWIITHRVGVCVLARAGRSPPLYLPEFESRASQELDFFRRPSEENMIVTICRIKPAKCYKNKFRLLRCAEGCLEQGVTVVALAPRCTPRRPELRSFRHDTYVQIRGRRQLF